MSWLPMEPELAGESPVLPEPVVPEPVVPEPVLPEPVLPEPVVAGAELQADWSQYPSHTEQDCLLQVLPYS